MSVFVRTVVSKRCLVRFLTLLALFFVMTSLLIMTFQELRDSGVYARAVSSTSDSAGRHPCSASLDAFGAQLGKILDDWKTGADGRGGIVGGVVAGGVSASITEAVRTLTDNKVLLEKRHAHRLIYLADVLQGYKEWMLQKMEEEEGGRRTLLEDEAVKEVHVVEHAHAKRAEELVKALENVTRINETVWPIYMNLHAINRTSYELPTWKIFHNEISQLSLYTENSLSVEQLLSDMVKLPIKSISPLHDDGTQIKLVFSLEDGSRVLFKPKRLRRDQEESLDTYYMYERERHTAEIAAFHLDRLLGFRRVPPAVGRYIDMIEDIYNHADDDLRNTFYKSPIGNECFFGLCEYFCDAGHGVCGNGTTLEGSFVSYLPSRFVAPRLTVENPWKRSYSKFEEADWETTEDGREYCAYARSETPWDTNHALLTVIDTHIFDFFTGNKDRHHFEMFSKYGNGSSPALFDNGKGFGRATCDVISILAPLYQCCIVRYSTLLQLLDLETAGEGRLLSDRMRQSLSDDVLQGILTEKHLEALDRRVSIVLDHVYDCIQQSSDVNEVVKDVNG